MPGSRNLKKRKTLESTSPCHAALQWLDERIQENQDLENTLYKKIPALPKGTWVFDDGNSVISAVPENLLLKKFTGKKGEDCVQDEDGEIKKIINIDVLRARKSKATMRFLHDGKKVPLFLLNEKFLFTSGKNQIFIETPHGNVQVVSADAYHQRTYRQQKLVRKRAQSSKACELAPLPLTVQQLPFLNGFIFPPLIPQQHLFAQLSVEDSKQFVENGNINHINPPTHSPEQNDDDFVASFLKDPETVSSSSEDEAEEKAKSVFAKPRLTLFSPPLPENPLATNNAFYPTPDFG